MNLDAALPLPGVCLQQLVFVVPGIVDDEVDFLVRIRFLDLVEQLHGSLGIERIGEVNYCLHLLDVEHAVDVQPLSAGVCRDTLFRAFLDPRSRGVDVMARMDTIAEQYDLVFGQPVSQCFVPFLKLGLTPVRPVYRG